MAWRWRRRKPPPDVPRRNWTRLPPLNTTISGASTLLTHTDLFEDSGSRPAPRPDAGPAGQAGGIVRPHPAPETEPDQPDGTVGELPEPARTMPVVWQHTETPIPLTRTSAATVGTPQQSATPFHNITDFDRLMAQYENLDAEGIASAISMSSVAEPRGLAPEPTPVDRGRSLHRATLAQSRRLGLTARNRVAATMEPEAPQETEQNASEPTRKARVPGELVYRASPWSAATGESAVPRTPWTAATISPAELQQQPGTPSSPQPEPVPLQDSPADSPQDHGDPPRSDSDASDPTGPVAAQEWALPGIVDLPSGTDVSPSPPDQPPVDAELRRDLQDLRATVRTLTARPEPPDLTDPDTVSDLAGRLYRHIRSRLRAELLIDRERHGTLADHW
nr:hypothetical protein [Kibdelosporangium sp. MJ126-NF4]CEL12814.1 hypothetical protein [Kibdelosporangium sp. MJ126-NF4]CTQ98500.1 hypothetical protein [Kibdelosporangium sp. MJ126-NF4]